MPDADPADGALVYWGVTDVTASVAIAIAAGAAEHSPVSDVGDGIVTATVRSPNRIPDGDDRFTRLLAAPGEAGPSRALALHEHGYLVFWAGDHDRAAARLRESLDLATSLDDASLQALALAGLARVSALHRLV